MIMGSGSREASPVADARRGGWSTATFILGSVAAMALAGGGCLTNLVVFLINEFNIKRIDAAQISNIMSGCTSFIPIVAAVLADAFLGCFTVVWISFLLSLSGVIILVLTVSLPSLRPPDGVAGASSCTTPSRLQYSVLCTALTLVAVGSGGTSFTLGTMGANQFTEPEHLSSYFNWYFLVSYVASFASATGIVYIEDNVSWGWGFGICLAANVIGLAMFLARSRFYKKDRRRGAINNPWRICTFKTLIKFLPLWSSGLFLSIPIALLISLTILQALVTDRHFTNHHFQIPAGSIIVFSLISTAISLGLFSRGLWPLWRKVTGQRPTLLQRVGVGHILNITSMVVSAVIESKRRAQRVPISVFWLVPQMVIVGSGEACHFPGQVELYYQEFPNSLKSMSTAMVSMLIGCGYYLSTAVMGLVRKTTSWLPNDIDEGRVDNVYWMMAVTGVLNYGYFLGCCWFYGYKKKLEMNS